MPNFYHPSSATGRVRRPREKEGATGSSASNRRQRSTIRSLDNKSPPPKSTTPQLYAQHNITSHQISAPSSPRTTSPLGVKSPKLKAHALGHGAGNYITLASVPHTPVALQAYLDNDDDDDEDNNEDDDGEESSSDEEDVELLSMPENRGKPDAITNKETEVEKIDYAAPSRDKRFSISSVHSVPATSSTPAQNSRRAQPPCEPPPAIKPTLTRVQTAHPILTSEVQKAATPAQSQVLPQFMPQTQGASRPASIVSENSTVLKSGSTTSPQSMFSQPSVLSRVTTQTPPSTTESLPNDITPIPVKGQQALRSFTPPDISTAVQPPPQTASPQVMPMSMHSSFHSDFSSDQSFGYRGSPRSFATAPAYGQMRDSQYLPQRVVPYYPEYAPPQHMSYFYQPFRQPYMQPTGNDVVEQASPELTPQATEQVDDETGHLLQRIQHAMPDFQRLLGRYQEVAPNHLGREGSIEHIGSNDEVVSEKGCPPDEHLTELLRQREEAVTKMERTKQYHAEIITQQDLLIREKDKIIESKVDELKVAKQQYDDELSALRAQLRAYEERHTTSAAKIDTLTLSWQELSIVHQHLQTQHEESNKKAKEEILVMKEEHAARDADSVRAQADALHNMEMFLNERAEATLQAKVNDIKTLHTVEREAMEVSWKSRIRDIEENAQKDRQAHEISLKAAQADMRDAQRRNHDARDKWDEERKILHQDLRDERTRSSKDLDNLQSRLHSQHKQEKIALQASLEAAHGDAVRRLEREHAETTRKTEAVHSDVTRRLEKDHSRKMADHEHSRKGWDSERHRMNKARTEMGAMVLGLQKVLDALEERGK